MAKTFTVQSRDTKQGVKLPIRGSRKQVESYVLGMFSIEPATDDELITFGQGGTEIIDAGNAKE